MESPILLSGLDTLPEEVLNHVASYLDLPTALSFALVARRYFLPAQTRVWSTLDLTLNPSFSVRPWSTLYHTYPLNPCVSPPKATDEYVAAALEKVMPLQAADRWALVREMSLMSRPCLLGHMLEFLDRTSSHIRSLIYLEYEDPDSDLYEYDNSDRWIGIPLETIIGSKLSFPLLTQLTMSYATFQQFGLIASLCQSAPNLVSLEFGIRDESGIPRRLIHQLLTSTTKIQHLRMLFYGEVEDLGEVVEADAVLDTMISILAHSPAIRDLSIDYIQILDDGEKLLLDTIANMPDLIDFSFRDVFCEHYAKNSRAPRIASSGGLRRLILESEDCALPVSMITMLVLHGTGR